MVKHAQSIRRQLRTNCLSVFDHFVGLVLKGLRLSETTLIILEKASFLKLSKEGGMCKNGEGLTQKKGVPSLDEKMQKILFQAVFDTLCDSRSGM